MPALGAIGLLFSMASLGLPGLGNFIAEFLTLLGTFKVSALFAVLASLGLIAATIYSLRIVQKVFFGRNNSEHNLKDLSIRESVILGAMVVAILFTGLFPQPFITTARAAVSKTIGLTGQALNSGIEKQNIEGKNVTSLTEKAIEEK
jgi:NADH-quinone oxidoreductase subunit M